MVKLTSHLLCSIRDIERRGSRREDESEMIQVIVACSQVSMALLLQLNVFACLFV